MTDSVTNPPFGAADLTNCARELIQLPGSVQPHGALLILHPSRLHVLQASLNAEAILGEWGASPLGKHIDTLDPALGRLIRRLQEEGGDTTSLPSAVTIQDGGEVRQYEVLVHRLRHEGYAVELEPVVPVEEVGTPEEVAERVARILSAGIASLGAAASATALYEDAARVMKELAGYDRVMVYRFDPEGHGEIVGEAREERLEPFLGLHYPESDIPAQARELYLKNRIRVLVDVGYEPAPLFPRLSPMTGGDVDMSMIGLRSMSPLHLQYLSNMGVRATLVASLTRGERLWGLMACHHYSTRRIPFEVRTACNILAEMVATRLAALESLDLAQADLVVKRLEQQVVEGLATTGEWRTGFFSSPRQLLAALGANGAALLHEDQLVTAGEVPSSEDIRRIAAWVTAVYPTAPVFATHGLSRLAPEFEHLTAVASGVLAIPLSSQGHDYLLWFRAEQRQAVRWAGDPRKPVDPDDPNKLSPRRSFAVWTEVTRATSKHWSEAELSTARAIRRSLVDMVQQVQAVRVLIAHDQYQRVVHSVQAATEPTLVMNSVGKVLVANRAFKALLAPEVHSLASAEDLLQLFEDEAQVGAMLGALRVERRLWQGELRLRAPGEGIPLAIRAEPVPAEAGTDLGYVLFATDLRARHESEALRQRVHEVMAEASRLSRLEASDAQTARTFGAMLEAIHATARRAVSELAERNHVLPLPATLASVEALTRRAAALALQLESYTVARLNRPS